jgi:UDP-N-acetylmuramyl pentapeptide synthase
MHAALADALVAAHVDTVFLAGPLMRSLWEVLPKQLRGAHAETAAVLEPAVIKALAPGDVVMVKGSNGSRMGPLVESIKARLAPAAAAEDRQEQETA